LKANIRRDTVAIFTAQTFYRLSGFILLIVLSRRLGATDIGRFFFAVASAESLIVLSHFGTTSIMSRRVASSPAEASTHFAPLLGFRLLSAPVYLITVIGAAAVFTSAPLWLAASTALITLLEDLYFSFGSLFLALRKALYNVTLGISIHTAYIIAFLVGMSLAPSLHMLVAVTMFRAGCLLAAGVWVTRRRLFPIAVRLDWAVVRAGIPFVMIAALHVLRDQIGTLILGTMSSYAAVAHFNLAWRLVASSYFVPTAICAVIVPIITAHGLTDSNRRLIRRAAAGVTGAGVSGASVAFFFALPLAGFMYGPLGDNVGPIIKALAVVFPLGFLALFLSLVLQALYEEAHVLRTLFLVTVVNLVANVLLVPRLGAQGAAYAQIASTGLQLGILALRLRALHEEAPRVGPPDYRVFPEDSP
jgi:O-antigen/teichoic acid export membrane protein